MKILLASNNENKLKEFKNMIGDYIDVVTPAQIGIDIDPEENGDTLEDNAKIKADAFWSEVVGKKLDIQGVISDDTGFYVEAYPELIGVKANRWHKGTPEDRNKKLLQILEKETNRNIYYKTVLCYKDESNTKMFKGFTYGEASTEIIEGNGFAYDSIFKLPNGKLISEITENEKNKISSRGIAVKEFIEYIKNKLGL